MNNPGWIHCGMGVFPWWIHVHVESTLKTRVHVDSTLKNRVHVDYTLGHDGLISTKNLGLAVSSLNVIISERVCIKLHNNAQQCFFVSSQQFHDRLIAAHRACESLNLSDHGYLWRLPVLSTNKKTQIFDEAMKNVTYGTVQNAVFWMALMRKDEKYRKAAKDKSTWADSTKWRWFGFGLSDRITLNKYLANGMLDKPKWKQHWNSMDDEPNNFVYRYEDSAWPEKCVMGEWNRGASVVWLDVPCDNINKFLHNHSKIFSKGFVKLHVCESIKRKATPTTTQPTTIHSTITQTTATDPAEVKPRNGESEEADTTNREGEVWPYVMIGVTVLLVLICVALVVVIVHVRQKRNQPARPMANGSSSAPEDSLSPFFQPTRKKKRKMEKETDEMMSRPDSGSERSIIKKNREDSLDLISEMKSQANVEKKEMI